jgi:opacity protein-like surface antigen
MKKTMLAAFAATAIVAAPAAAFAQQNPLQPEGGILQAINCLLTCHNHSEWFTFSGSAKTKHYKPKHSYKFKPKYGGYNEGPSFRGFSNNKGPKFGFNKGFNKGPQFGFNKGFNKGPQFGFNKGFNKGPQSFGNKSKFSNFGGRKKVAHYKPHKPGKTTGTSTRHTSHGFPFYVGAVVCSAAGPIINAALGGPEPTSEQMVRHTVGCFVPPLGLVFFLQDMGAI